MIADDVGLLRELLDERELLDRASGSGSEMTSPEGCEPRSVPPTVTLGTD